MTYSFTHVYEQLEEDFSWRRDEIRLLHNQLLKMDLEDEKKRFRKAMIAMLYSHFEGFCYASLSLYIDVVNSLKLQRSQVNQYLVTASMAEIFREYENKERKSSLFKKLDDSKLHHFSRQVDFIAQMNDFLSEEVKIPSIVVDTENNIGPDVLRKLLFRLGLPYDEFQIHRGEIMQLLNSRNGIAHGTTKEGIEEKAYQKIEDATFNTMRGVIKLIIEALNNKKFLKQPAPKLERDLTDLIT